VEVIPFRQIEDPFTGKAMLSLLIIPGVRMQFLSSNVMKNCVQLLQICLANVSEGVILLPRLLETDYSG
jgi:hypothetical protein